MKRRRTPTPSPVRFSVLCLARSLPILIYIACINSARLGSTREVGDDLHAAGGGMKERQLTVLIAAPRRKDRDALREALSGGELAHYTVIEAEDWARALELRRARKPDCVILDHELPDLASLEALKKLAAREESPACGMVVLVDEGDARLAVEAMKSGAHDCLERNRARGEVLLRAVRHAIENAERRR